MLGSKTIIWTRGMILPGAHHIWCLKCEHFWVISDQFVCVYAARTFKIALQLLNHLNITYSCLHTLYKTFEPLKLCINMHILLDDFSWRWNLQLFFFVRFIQQCFIDLSVSETHFCVYSSVVWLFVSCYCSKWNPKCTNASITIQENGKAHMWYPFALDRIYFFLYTYKRLTFI